MPKSIGVNPDIWLDEDFRKLTTEEKLGLLAYAADAEHPRIPALPRERARELFLKFTGKGLLLATLPGIWQKTSEHLRHEGGRDFRAESRDAVRLQPLRRV
jgi:hypothetical protein